jgi:hypothetical protein
MAAPVKNYSNPVAISRIFDAVVGISLPGILLPSRSVVSPLQVGRIPLVMAVQMPPRISDPDVPRIPPPPMGKLMLSTFPPAYKSITVRIGQVFPRGLR